MLGARRSVPTVAVPSVRSVVPAPVAETPPPDEFDQPDEDSEDLDDFGGLGDTSVPQDEGVPGGS